MKPLHLITAALTVALIAVVVLDVRPGPAPTSRSAAAAETAPKRPAGPLATARGTEPHTSAELLELRRSGPKVVTARLRISLDRLARDEWLPELEGDEGTWYTAEGLRLLDEVNGREHFPLIDVDGDCLCSSDIGRIGPGQSTFVSAKFPAPPADVSHVSLHVPGFESFDSVALP
jgi:hypothetical protein